MVFLHTGTQLITSRRTITFPFLPSEWTSWVNTGVILALFVAYEAFHLRRAGLYDHKLLAKHGAVIDRIGHLGGYGAGIAGASLLRQYDPKWRDLERHSFWNWKTKSVPKTKSAQALEAEGPR